MNVDIQFAQQLYLVESEELQAFCASLVQEKLRVRAAAVELIRSIKEQTGQEVRRGTFSKESGVLTGVLFPRGQPSDWKKPWRNGCSAPKLTSPWHKRLGMQVGHESFEKSIGEKLGVPTSVSYKTKGGEGMRMIGVPFHACGLAHFSEHGPFVIWTPDVDAILGHMRANGEEPDEEFVKFDSNVPGTRKLSRAEYDLMCAEHEVAKERAAAEAALKR